MYLSALIFPFILACTNDKDGDTGSAFSAANSFTEETQVGPLDEALFERFLEDSDPDRGSYFPARKHFWPLGLVAVDAPEPPYEIRSISTFVLAGAEANCSEFDSEWECQQPADCDTTVPLTLVAYVGDASPRSFGGGEADLELPSVPFVASVEVSGGVGAPGTWDGERLDGVFDSPVLIEEPGTLWIGYAQSTESGEKASCPGGYTASPSERSDSDGNSMVWWEQNNLFSNGATGWNQTEESEEDQLRVIVQATLGH